MNEAERAHGDYLRKRGLHCCFTLYVSVRLGFVTASATKRQTNKVVGSAVGQIQVVPLFTHNRLVEGANRHAKHRDHHAIAGNLTTWVECLIQKSAGADLTALFAPASVARAARPSSQIEDADYCAKSRP